MESSASVPRVGTGTVVVRDGLVLIGKRIGSHGKDCWSFPGGHLEFGESLEGCAMREVLEETGLTVRNPRIIGLTNDVFQESGKHYVTIFVQAEYAGGEPEVTEPDRWERWEWHPWDALPRPLFLPIEHALEQGLKII